MDSRDEPRFVDKTLSQGGEELVSTQRRAGGEDTLQWTAPGEAQDPVFAPGDRLAGRYRIVKFLAQGGMGEVYEAEDLELGERIALKTLKLERSRERIAIERFRREVLLARRVTHPNVCRLFDCGVHEWPEQPEQPGRRIQFLTMELLNGPTLLQRLRTQGPFSTEAVLPLVRPIVLGLEAAHAAGVVHRDFKSSNVLLVPAGGERERVVLTDFGLARSQDPNAASISVVEGSNFVGTPAYMAPEQVEGRPPTIAVDIYALGVVLYEMVTGTLPFRGQSVLEIAVKRLMEAPEAPSARMPGLAPLWERVILRCLERLPENRFASVREVLDALEGRLPLEPPAPAPAPASPPPPAAPPLPTIDTPPPPPVAPAGGYRRGRGRRKLLVSLALGLLLALGAVGVLWKTPPPKTRRPLALIGMQGLSPDRQLRWLSVALEEMLDAELATSEDLRLVPAVDVARMRHELHLTEGSWATPESLSAIELNLGASLLLSGTFQVRGEPPEVELRLTLHDLGTGNASEIREQGALTELGDLVARVGWQVRAALGVGRSSTLGGGAYQAIPVKPEAAKLYAEGLRQLRDFQPEAARALLEKAIEAEPEFPLAYGALASAWQELGNQPKAGEMARKAVELSASLGREERLKLEAYSYEMNDQWPEAVHAYQALSGFFEDNLEYGVRLGQAQLELGQPSEAEATLLKLRRLGPEFAEDPRVDYLDLEIGDSTGDYARLARAAERTARKAAERRSPHLEAEALSMLAWAHMFLSEPEPALEAAHRARQAAQEYGSPLGLAEALSALQTVLSQQGRHTQAVTQSREALRLRLGIGDHSGAINDLQNIRYDLLLQGEVEQASLAGQQLETLGLKLTTDGERLSQLYFQGWQAYEEGRFDDALEAQRSAAEGWKRLGNQRKLGTSTRRLADALWNLGRLEEAREQYRAALQQAQAIHLDWYEAQARQAWAEFEAEAGDPNTVEALVQPALETFRKLDAVERLADVETSQARASLRLGQEPRAREIAGRLWPKIGELDNWLIRSRILAVALDASETREFEAPARALLQELESRGARRAADRLVAALHRFQTRPEKPEFPTPR